VVPEGEIFVSGDNRDDIGGLPNSYDSRNGLGTVPFFDIIGPAAVRIFPLDSIRTF
jgi:signal peptidase I